jgi:hypothetical protein
MLVTTESGYFLSSRKCAAAIINVIAEMPAHVLYSMSWKMFNLRPIAIDGPVITKNHRTMLRYLLTLILLLCMNSLNSIRMDLSTDELFALMLSTPFVRYIITHMQIFDRYIMNFILSLSDQWRQGKLIN